MVRPDGSFATAKNPAARGETVHLYITGLGPVQPAVTTNAIPAPGVDSLSTGNVVVAVNNSGVRVVSARRAPGLIGADDIAFQIPSDAATGLQTVYVIVGFTNPSGFFVSNASFLSIQ